MKKGNTGNTATVVAELAAPIAKELSLVLWDVLFEKEGSEWNLKIIIDKESEVVSIDDCEALSRKLDAVLDKEDPIEQSYCLEVSSAGPERALSKEWHFQRYLGQKVSVRLIRPFNGQRDFIGELLSYENDAVSVKTEKESFEFKLSDIAFVRLYMEF